MTPTDPLPLRGKTVVVTGLPPLERVLAEQAVAQLGGTVPAADAVLRREDPPVACVAGCVYTGRYAACASLQLPTPVPVVKPSWLRACLEAKRLVPTEGHALGPLAGLVVSLTGGHPDDKRRISEALERAGAFYSADLTRRCTHLVVVRGRGTTAAAADEEAAAATAAVAAAAAATTTKKQAAAAAPAPPLRLPPPPSRDLPRLDPPSKKERYARHWGVPVLWDSWVAAATQQPRYSRSLEREHFVPKAAIGAAAAEAHAAGAAAGFGGGAGGAGGSTRGRGGTTSKEEEEEDSMFLDGCRVFLTGTSGAAERRALLSALRQGGATLKRALLPGNAVTHAVVGEFFFLVF